MANKCRDCLHVETDMVAGQRIHYCTKGRWDRGAIHQWYAESTILRNRLPIRVYGADCTDFKPATKEHER